MKKDLKILSPFILDSGSGLTTSNRLSAKQVVALLSYMSIRTKSFSEFLSSLPKSGVNGTLLNRFRDEEVADLKGIVRAKTGTLTEPFLISSLAGYVFHTNHGLIAFALLQNSEKNLKK